LARKRKPKKPSLGEFVLDCSLALAWYFRDEAVPYADTVAASFLSSRALVPVIWPLEIANAVLMGERRQRSTEAQAAKWLSYLSSLPIVIDEGTNDHAWSEALALGRAHRLSAYDASYLELALRRGLPLASLDDKLTATASALGVARFVP
jgi:predicted nucleic acid-binding protein